MPPFFVGSSFDVRMQPPPVGKAPRRRRGPPAARRPPSAVQPVASLVPGGPFCGGAADATRSDYIYI
eukprot:scaffold8270_cov124-Isochrysis_galbana.AAC.1